MQTRRKGVDFHCIIVDVLYRWPPPQSQHKTSTFDSDTTDTQKHLTTKHWVLIGWRWNWQSCICALQSRTAAKGVQAFDWKSTFNNSVRYLTLAIF